MENIFYAIVNNNGKFIHCGVSSSRCTVIILNVAPSSATFFNWKHEAIDALGYCREEYPNEDFTVKEFIY